MPCIEMEPGILPAGLTAFQQYQVYNNLDSAVTAQLLPVMWASAEPQHRLAYIRSLWTQSLCLDMSAKGFPCNKLSVLQLIHELDSEASKALQVLHLFCDAIWAPRMNPNSWQQVETFFYDFLDLPVIWKYDHKTKQRKRGTDRDSLEKLRDSYPSVRPFVSAIFTYREAVKLAGVFKRGLEADGRLRCQFSPTGTKTRRLSSQTNPFGRGTNAQNLNDRVRQVVEAPDGFDLVYIDLKTAESYAVGYIANEKKYIAAVESGDLHTAVARLTWPGLAWTGVLKADREVAEQIFYRSFSYRDMAKRGGHGTNYYGKPGTMAMHLKVDKALMESFQAQYFEAFPGIPEWHKRVIAQIQQTGLIRNVFGIERMFWGRRTEEKTYRDAIAHEPQGTVAEIMNQGLVQVQQWILKERLNVGLRPELLAQVHDAGLFLVPSRERDQIIPEMLNRIVVPVHYPGVGTMAIPADAQVGKNWAKAKFDKKTGKWKNPAGLVDWKPGLELQG